MDFFKSVKGRLAVMVAVAIVVTGVVVLLYGFFIARSILKQQVFKSMDGAVSRTVREVETTNAEMASVTAVVAADPVLRGELAAFIAGTGDATALGADITGVLDGARAAVPSLQSISIYGLEGATVASTPGAPGPEASSLRTAIAAVRSGKPILDFSYSDGGIVVSRMSGIRAPDSTGLIGVVALSGRATELEKVLVDMSGLGETGEILLSKNQSGRVMVLDLPEPRAPDERRVGGATVVVGMDNRLPQARAALGDNGSGEFMDGAGRKIVAAYGAVPEFGWGVTATTLSSDAFAPIYGLRNIIMIVVLVLLIGGSLLAYLIARSITRPLVELQTGVKAFAGGDMSIRVTISDGLEVTALADEFNNMADRLNELYQNLERKVAERTVELRAANERLRKLDQLKSEFVSVVSHELRSPLSSMKLGISSVASGVIGPVSHEQKQMLSIADRNLDRLTKLTTDLLDLDRIEAGKLRLRVERCDVLEPVREVAEASGPQARQAGLYLEVESHPRQGALEALCDRDRVYQVIQNLVSNALKFTEEGGVTMTVEKVDEAGQRAIRVCVVDTGTGIPPDELPTIFERFSQAHNETRSEKRGTGLGLAISKGIVEAHGGTITATSERCAGSTFCFTVPAAGVIDDDTGQ